MIADYKIPWPVVPLKEVACLIRGVSFSGSEAFTAPRTDHLPVLRAGNISDRLIIENDLVWVPNSRISDEQRLRVGDIVISMSSGSASIVGKTAALEKDWDGAVGAFCAIIRPLGNVDPYFLAAYLKADQFSQWRKNQAQGANIQNLKNSELVLFPTPLPPLSEQRRIAEILKEAEEIRRLHVKAEAKTAELIPSIYHRMFLASDRRKNWKEVTVTDISAKSKNSIRTGPFGSDLLHSEFVDSGVPVLGIDNVVTNRFGWAERRYISLEKYSDLDRFRVFPGDVMITIMGTVGRVAIAPKDLPKSISSKHLCVITPNTEIILSSFLWATLLYDPSVRAQTKAVAKGAVMEGWNSKIIRSLRFPIPPLDLQRKFESQVEQVLKISGKQSGKAIGIALGESLSANAFSGQLTEEWREQHKDMLALEARDRDNALKAAGAALPVSRRATVQDLEEVLELPTDGIYSELNNEQRLLLLEIRRMVSGVDYARYFTAETLGEFLSTGMLRRNPQAIEGHLSVFAARGLIIPVSREEQTGDTGAFVFGKAYRMPLEDREDFLSTEAGEEILTEAGEEIIADQIIGDSSRLREMDRLGVLFETEWSLE